MLRFVRKIFWFTAYLCTFLFAVAFIYFVLDKEGDCASSGNVWDSQEHRCRTDCLTWNEINGCIHINDEYQRLAMACWHKTAECDKKKLFELDKELCKKYNAPYNTDNQYCDFEFTKDKCYQLEGNWEYPDICENK